MSKRRGNNNQAPLAASSDSDNMASNSTSIQNHASNEQEPLLGRAGAVQQKEDDSFFPNLIQGTGFLAQIGLLLFVASVWSVIFTHDLNLFSAHPLLNSAGIFLLFQGALVVQPTHTAAQKKKGAFIHAAFNGTAVTLLMAGFGVILANKIRSGNKHFQSPHAICGLIAYACIPCVSVFGNLMFFFPNLLGGENQAKSFYKFHRMFGYFCLVLLLAVAIGSTQTYYVKNVLHLYAWQPAVASALILAGLIPRIKKQKLGFGNRR